MADYIDREAVIYEQKRFYGYLDEDMLYRLEFAVRKIPAADVVTWEQLRRAWQIATAGEPQVRRGHWIEDNLISKCRCSECDEEWSYFDNDTDTFDYCPHCGALMEGENTE